jgi:hypothetical protein
MTALHIRKNIRELLEMSVTAAKKLEDVQVASLQLGTKTAIDSWRRKAVKFIEPS